MLHSVRMGDPGNEGVDSVSSQVAEAVLGSKGPWPPGLVDYFQSYQISLGKCSCRSGAWPGCGPLSPPPPTPHWLLHSLSSSPVCSSPQPWEEIRARVITPLPCKQAEAQRGSASSLRSHSKLVTAEPS